MTGPTRKSESKSFYLRSPQLAGLRTIAPRIGHDHLPLGPFGQLSQSELRTFPNGPAWARGESNPHECYPTGF